jgi:DNA-binding MarR family transcriptional regulator
VSEEANSIYRFGDLLALARASWVAQMERELDRRGFAGYRRSDAATMRRLLAGPVPIGVLGAMLGITRQAARKVATALEQRGHVATRPDPDDARKVNIVLTAKGRRYASAVVAVVEQLNRAVAERVAGDRLAAADEVLRAVVAGEQYRALADRVPPPAALVNRCSGRPRPRSDR